jgi:hypothetical protein
MPVRENNFEVIVLAQVSIWMFEVYKKVDELVVVLLLVDCVVAHQTLFS